MSAETVSISRELAQKLYECEDFVSRNDDGPATRKDAAENAESLRAALDAPAQGWQPIESAPVNQAVLIHIPGYEHYGPAVYRAIQVDMGTGRRWMVTGLSMGRDLHHDQQPDSWQPLPQPPSPPKSDAPDNGRAIIADSLRAISPHVPRP